MHRYQIRQKLPLGTILFQPVGISPRQRLMPWQPSGSVDGNRFKFRKHSLVQRNKKPDREDPVEVKFGC